MGSTAEEIAELLRACDAREEIAALELNVSCPNVHTGLDIGADPVQLERVVRAVRPATAKPLIVKLTPNCADVGACALAAEAGGADAVSLINTLRQWRSRPAAPGRAPRRAPLAGRWHRWALGRRHPTGRARSARCRHRTRVDPRDRHGRSPDAPPMPTSFSTSAQASWRLAPRASAIPPRARASRRASPHQARAGELCHLRLPATSAARPRRGDSAVGLRV